MDSLARPLAEKDPSRTLAKEVAQLLHAKRGEDIVILDVGDLLQIASYFVLVTGSSARRLKALADEADRLLKKSDLRKLGLESDREGRWICLDYSDLVVHLFDAEARTFYDLDHLWGDTPRVPFEPAPADPESLEGEDL